MTQSFRSPKGRPSSLSCQLVLGWALLAAVGAVGCKDGSLSKEAASATPHRQSSPALASPTNLSGQGTSTNIMRSFQARGVIRELSSDGKTVMVRHEEIPGYMPKMTMEFNVRESNELRGLQKGDAITFLVRATEEDSWIEGIQRGATNGLVPLPAPDPSAAALLQVAQLKPGDLMPDAELLSEEGRAIRLSDFAGQAVAFTFIFTRCPLPDFCPRMNQHFKRAQASLQQRADGPTNWLFLSISFDPDFDKPGVLSRYAYSYRGPSADRWLFAAAATNVVASMSPLLDFRFANEGGSFLHNLRTVVLDPQRRVHAQFDGNSWKTDGLVGAISEAAQKPRETALK